jgi:telomerase reverse transcriptase
MFEEIKAEDAQKILNSRNISFSYVRLLPKEIGVRPVMNLKRRVPKGALGNSIGSSINSVLAPLFNVLTYEKV